MFGSRLRISAETRYDTRRRPFITPVTACTAFLVVAISTLTRQPFAKEPLEARFARLAAEWKRDSRFLSNSAQMAMLRSYQRIIGMGMPVVPLILQELARDPDQWFWALEAITEQNPVPAQAAGKVSLMAQAWIQWGKAEGLLPT